VELTEHDHYGLDVVVARADAPLDDRGYLAEPPLLCVEIRSPSTWRYDIGRKKSVYEAEGVAEVWLVDDVAEVVLVFRRSTPTAGVRRRPRARHLRLTHLAAAAGLRRGTRGVLRRGAALTHRLTPIR
jgi:Uma2 family endonuclease